MKKFFALVLCVALLCMAGTALAVDVYPGGQAVVPFSVSHSGNAYNFEVYYSCEVPGATFAGSTSAGGCTNPGAGGCFSYANLTVAFSGSSLGTITFNIPDGTPAGTYNVYASVAYAVDQYDNDVTFNASAASITVLKPACSHNWVLDEDASVDVTCDADGTEVYNCSACGETDTKTIKCNGHLDVVTDEAVEATCKNAGKTEGSHCEACGEIIVAQEDIPQAGHVPETVGAKDPTCTEPGSTGFQQCVTCGNKLSEATEVPATGHTEETVPGKEATCKDTGLTDGVKCSVCDATITEQEEIPVSETHTSPVTDEAVAPTCSSTGLTEGSHCELCGATIVAQQEVGKLEHTPVTDEAKAPTCTETGLTEGSHCGVCGETIVAQETIDSLGHTEETVPGWATSCEKPGMTDGVKCSVCGETLVEQEEIAQLPHTPKAGGIYTPPTCTTPGYQEFVCDVCGTDVPGQVVGCIPHDYTEPTTRRKDPTCTSDGYEYRACKLDPKCNKTKYFTLPKLGHAWGETVVTPATCTANGTEVTPCTREGCKYKETVPLNRLGHEQGETIVVPATCTENGKEYWECQREGCDHEQLVKKLWAPGSHKWGPWSVDTPATCTEKGKEIRECTRENCDAVDERDIPITHQYGEWEVNPDTGKKQRVCASCGDVNIFTGADYVSTACTLGIRFRDLDKSITDKWYMFTPIDISVDGEQTFDLIAGNMHKIGVVTVLVQEGNVTVTYKVNNPHTISVDGEFMTILPSIADVEKLDIDALTAYEFGEPISIEETLGGDTKVLLLVRNNVFYGKNVHGVTNFKRNSKEYKQLVEDLKLLMD